MDIPELLFSRHELEHKKIRYRIIKTEMGKLSYQAVLRGLGILAQLYLLYNG